MDRVSSSIARNSTFIMSWEAALCFAVCNISGLKSTPVTLPAGPTTFAMVKAGSPAPVATSSTILPEVIPADLMSWSDTGVIDASNSFSYFFQPGAAAFHSKRERCLISSSVVSEVIFQPLVRA